MSNPETQEYEAVRQKDERPAESLSLDKETVKDLRPAPDDANVGRGGAGCLDSHGRLA